MTKKQVENRIVELERKADARFLKCVDADVRIQALDDEDLKEYRDLMKKFLKKGGGK